VFLCRIGIISGIWSARLWPVCLASSRDSSCLYRVLMCLYRRDVLLIVGISLLNGPDDVCISKCAEQDFPCFDYRYENPSAATFEQVG
jgi:hypothetical protein